MAILFFACLTLFLTLAAYHKHSTYLQFILQFLPFCFLFVFLWLAKDRYEIIQVRKLGYEFEKLSGDHQNPARAIFIGGSTKKDDILSKKLPPAAIKITPSLSDSSCDLQVLSDGVLVTRNDIPLNRTLLNDGDVVEIGHEKVMYRARGAFFRSFVSGGKEWIWPRQSRSSGKIKKPSFTASLNSEMHPLSEIETALNLEHESRSAFVLEAFRAGGTRHPLRVNAVSLIGAADIRINSITQPVHFPLHDGDVIAAYLISDDETGTHLDRAIRFHIKNGETVAFLEATPETVGIKKELLKGGVKTEKPLLITTTSLPYSAFPTIHYGLESEIFSELSAFVQLQRSAGEDGIFGRLRSELSRLLGAEQSQIEVVTENAVYHPQDDQPFSLGKTDKLLFSLHQVHFPWQLLQIVLLIVVLKTLFQPPFFSSIENPPPQLILVTIDFFFALRMLFAFRADSLFPFSHKALDLSLLGWLLLPYILFAALLLKRDAWQRVHVLHFVCYSVSLVAVTAIVLPHHLWMISILALCASLFGFFKFHPRAALLQWEEHFRMIGNLPFEMFLLLIVTLAVVFYFCGAGEALQIFGMRVPLSLLYHPAFLLLSSKCLFDLLRVSQEEKTAETLMEIFRLLMKSVAVFAAFLFISFLMADLGFFLLYCLPLLFPLFGCAALLISQYELKWKLAGFAAAIPLALMFLSLFSTSTLEGILPQSYIQNRYAQRILLAVDPTALEESGLIAAERQLGHQRTFLAYSHGGLQGAGYMQRPVTSALAATALNDNVPSVFLLNDFGLLGASGVFLILFLWIWLWLNSRPTSAGFNFGRILSLASLITIVFVDTYMILSNSGVFLFTGKNVFLWGLNSTSDLLHSSLLFCFLLLPISQIAETVIRPGDLELPMSFVGELKRV